MHVDPKPIIAFIKKYVLSKKGIAICIMLIAATFAYTTITNRVMPMAYGSGGVEAVGADPTDLAATAVSILTAIISFVASNYLGVKPEVIQAVIAFEKDKSNPETQRRLGAAILGYLIDTLQKHPDGPGGFILSLLTTLTGAISDPKVKEILSIAATSLAANQFKPVPQNTVALPVK